MQTHIQTHTYMNELKTAVNVALLKKEVMHHVATDKSKTRFAYIIIVIAALLGLIGQQVFPIFFRPSIGFSLLTAVMQVVGAVVGIYVMSYIAKKLFHGAAEHDQFFRVAAYAMIVGWISLIPQLSWIGGIWGLVLIVVILKTIHRLTTGGVIGTIIVTIIVGFVASLVLTPILGLIGFSSGGMMGGKSIMNFGDNGFKFNVKTPEGETGSVEFGEGGMKIKTDTGETVEFNLPKLDTK